MLCKWLVSTSFFVYLVLVAFKFIIKRLGWLEKGYFIIFFKNDWNRPSLFVLFFIENVLISFEFKLVRILKRPLIWILEIYCYSYWKLAIPCIMDFKRMLIDCDQRFWETLMNLKFNFLYHKWKVLLLHWISRWIGIAEAAHVAAPLIRQLPVFTRNTDTFLQPLSNWAYNNWDWNLCTGDSFYNRLPWPHLCLILIFIFFLNHIFWLINFHFFCAFFCTIIVLILFKK